MSNWEQFIRERLSLPNLARKREQRIVRELAAQLDDFYRDALARGMPEEQAEAFARGQVRDWAAFAAEIRRADQANARSRIDRRMVQAEVALYRKKGGWQMQDLILDLRYALRQLRKNPGFAAVAVLSLAIGIGANTAIFSLVNAILLRALPFPGADRLVSVVSLSQRETVQPIPVSLPDLQDWRAQAHSFEHLSAVVPGAVNTVTITGLEEPIRAQLELVSANYFSLLGAHAALGRAFLPEDDALPEGNPVAVLSDRLWRQRFGADPAVVGKTIVFDDRAFTVVGVGPKDFGGYSGTADLWAPITVLPPSFRPFLSMRGARWFQVVGRLKPDATLAQAQTELETIAARLAEEYPRTNRQRSARVTSLAENLYGSVRQPVLILFASVGFVLLIVCANVGNLLIARAASRQKEIAIRTALGARPSHIARQLLAESLVLSLVGGAVGVFFSIWGVGLLRSLAGDNLPRMVQLNIDLPVLSFAFLLSLLTGIFFGWAPIVQAARVNLTQSLKEGERGSSVSLKRSFRSLMVVAEVALALILLAGAGLFLRTLQQLLAVDPGFVPAHTVVAQFDLPDQGVSRQRTVQFIDRLLERVRNLPGVDSAAVSGDVPLGNSGNAASIITVEGKPTLDQSDAVRVYFHECTAGFFEALGIPLRRGRTFTEEDRAGSLPVVVLTESAARRMWPDEDPLGKRIQFGSTRPDRKFSWLTVVGVVGDLRYRELGPGPDNDPDLFLSLAQNEAPIIATSFVVSARSPGDPGSLIPSLRQVVRDIDPNLPLYGVAPLETNIQTNTLQSRILAWMLGAFAATALVLAAMGIYGVISYSVNQRVREIGIRMTLGASRGHILAMIIRQGMALTLVGVILGIAGALALTRQLAALLFGVSPTDPVTFAGGSFVLVAAAFLACWIPAQRAMRVDPLVALRNE